MIHRRCKVMAPRYPHAGADASPRPGAEGLERVERTEGLECQGRPGAAGPIGAGEAHGGRVFTAKEAAGGLDDVARLGASQRPGKPLREGRNA